MYTTIKKHHTTLFLQDLRAKTNGKIFSVEFFKKNGELRKMNARFNVQKGLKGTGLGYDPLEKGLMPVYDMQAKGYRMVTIDNITRLKVNGITYNFGA